MRRLDLLRPGHLVGRYKVLDVLGQGGMAVVYRVRHESLGSLHALKVTAVPSRSILARLMKEGTAQARVRHRNIVAVHDVIEVEGCPGLIMEYISGPTLDELIEQGQLSIEQVDQLARGILRGVAAAHAEGLVHRDLKPANVMIAIEEDGWVPKVADFGLVKDVGAIGSDTRSGAFMGTPHYMAPEQIRDARSVDGRADVFALGAILYELLTARRAFEGTDTLEIFNRVAAGSYAPLGDLRADIPKRMSDAVVAALDIDANRRPPTVDALLAAWCGDVTDASIAPDSDTLARQRATVKRTPPEEPPNIESPTIAVTFGADASTGEHVAELPIATSETTSRRWRVAPLLVMGAGVGGSLLLLAGLGLAGGAVWLRPVTAPIEPLIEPSAVREAPEEPVPIVRAEPIVEVPPAPQPEARDDTPPPLPKPTPKADTQPDPPAPKPQAQPDPAPKPPPIPEPRPVPAPASPVGTLVRVDSGGLSGVMLRPADGGPSHSPNTLLSPGTYDVMAMVEGAPKSMMTIVVADVPIHITCSDFFKKCSKEP